MITGLAPLWKCAVHLGAAASAVRRMEVMVGRGSLFRGGPLWGAVLQITNCNQTELT